MVQFKVFALERSLVESYYKTKIKELDAIDTIIRAYGDKIKLNERKR